MEFMASKKVDSMNVRFPPTENKYDPSQAGGNGDDRKFTSLLRATRSVNGKGQKYLDVNTYSPWSHTVMLNDEDKVHWFVLRAKRGDHPCMSSILLPSLLSPYSLLLVHLNSNSRT